MIRSISNSFLLAGTLLLTSCSKDPVDELETVIIKSIERASEAESGNWIVSSHDVVETNSVLNPYRAKRH